MVFKEALKSLTGIPRKAETILPCYLSTSILENQKTILCMT